MFFCGDDGVQRGVLTPRRLVQGERYAGQLRSTVGQPAEDVEQLGTVVAQPDRLKEILCGVGGTHGFRAHHPQYFCGAVEYGDPQRIEGVVRYHRVQHQP
jgi:hypothetical protein